MPDLTVAPSPVLSLQGSPRTNTPSNASNDAATPPGGEKDFSATLRQRIQSQSKVPEPARAKTTERTAETTRTATATTTPPAEAASTAAPATPLAGASSLPLNDPALAARISASQEADRKAGGTTDTDHSDDANALLESLAGLAGGSATAPRDMPSESAKTTGQRGNPGPSDGIAERRSVASELRERAANLASTGADAAKVAAADSQDAPASTTSTAAPGQNFQASLDAARQMHATTQAVPASQLQAGHPVSRSDSPVGSQAWNQDVADRVVWMAGQKESRADLVLNPPHLGRIEISLTVSGDQASANFVAANPQVREALENALPRLREALGDVGIQLGQANVGANTPQFASQQGETGHNPASGRLRNDADSALAHDAGLAVSAPTARWQQQGTSLVDAFA